MEYLSSKKVRAAGFLDEKKVKEEVEQFYKYNGGRAEKNLDDAQFSDVG